MQPVHFPYNNNIHHGVSLQQFFGNGGEYCKNIVIKNGYFESTNANYSEYFDVQFAWKSPADPTLLTSAHCIDSYIHDAYDFYFAQMICTGKWGITHSGFYVGLLLTSENTSCKSIELVNVRWFGYNHDDNCNYSYSYNTNLTRFSYSTLKNDTITQVSGSNWIKTVYFLIFMIIVVGIFPSAFAMVIIECQSIVVYLIRVADCVICMCYVAICTHLVVSMPG